MQLFKILITSLLLINLTGCASFLNLFGERTKPIEVQTKAVERSPLNLPLPTPIQPRSPQWIVITPENADKVWQQLKDKKVDLVLFALTDDGYEELSTNTIEIRNLISSQRQLILKYKEYYEPKKEPEKKDGQNSRQ